MFDTALANAKLLRDAFPLGKVQLEYGSGQRKMGFNGGEGAWYRLSLDSNGADGFVEVQQEPQELVDAVGTEKVEDVHARDCEGSEGSDDED